MCRGEELAGRTCSSKGDIKTLHPTVKENSVLSEKECTKVNPVGWPKKIARPILQKLFGSKRNQKKAHLNPSVLYDAGKRGRKTVSS